MYNRLGRFGLIYFVIFVGAYIIEPLSERIDSTFRSSPAQTIILFLFRSQASHHFLTPNALFDLTRLTCLMLISWSAGIHS
jgi:hypothetical protein